MHSRSQSVRSRLGLCVLSFAAAVVLAPFSAAQGLRSGDLIHFRFVGGAELSPDNHHVAYTVNFVRPAGAALAAALDHGSCHTKNLSHRWRKKTLRATRTGPQMENGWHFRGVSAKSMGCCWRVRTARTSQPSRPCTALTVPCRAKVRTSRGRLIANRLL